MWNASGAEKIQNYNTANTGKPMKPLEVSPQLIKSCLNRERRAENQLFEQCYSLLMSICLRYEKNEEDARYMLNIGFMKVITNLERYNNDIAFGFWIRRIMVNTLIDEFRKNQRHSAVIEYNDMEEHVMQNRLVDWNTADQKFDAEELQNMVRQLPSVTQKIFNLFAIDGYSHKEIAEMLLMPEGTTKWHVSKARRILMELLNMKLKDSKVYLK